MAAARVRSHKHFRLDARKIQRAKKLLRADTETEAIDRALDFTISEYEKNRIAAKATAEFVNSGIHIRDVYGVLED